MTHFSKLLTVTLAVSCAAAFSAPTFAADKKTTATSAPLTANSSGALKKEYMGKHVDELPEVESSTKAVDNPDRIVCKEIKKTGSRLRKRKVCATKKEWDNLKDSSARAVRQMQLTRARSD